MAATVGISPSPSHLFTTRRHKSLRMYGGTMKNRSSRVGFVSASSRTSFADPYDTLSIRRDASESEVKKAFRRLALQYHPDVCKEDNCNVQFYQINEAYDECLQCVLDWYRLGSSDDDAEDDVEESAPDSPPRIWVVPDSLSPEDLGTQVLETEFDNGGCSMGLSHREDDRAKSPVTKPVTEKKSKSVEPDSPCTKYMNAFFKKRDENRKRKAELALLSPEKEIGKEKKVDFDPEGFKRFTDRWMKRH